MGNQLNLLGRLAGIIGALVCAFAVIARLLGNHYVIGVESATLLLGGTSCVAIGCFLLLLARADTR
jgi:hypothetical protein